MLKRQYGGSVTVYELVDATVNLDSGIKSATYNSYPISRAIVLPIHSMRSVIQTISVISANKKLVQGGTFDAGDRIFIIDRSDVPDTFELEKDDWIEYNGQRYDLKYVDEFEPNTSWLALGKVIEGVVAELHKREYPRDDLSITDTATAVVE
jgi:hypothetical protein